MHMIDQEQWHDPNRGIAEQTIPAWTRLLAMLGFLLFVA
jgi:hypothetical protein